jgi:hypothetical protein
MRFTLPAAPAPDAHCDLPLDDRHLLRFDTMVDLFEDGTELEIQCSLVLCFPNRAEFHSAQYLISGLGSTPADSLLAMFADEDVDGLRIPANVAAALDELAHQAVRIVCDRLCGGTLDSATFAAVPEGYVGHLCADDEEVECDEETLEDIEQRFLKLLAAQEPDHPWVCKLRTPREGNHPRSKEFVLR